MRATADDRGVETYFADGRTLRIAWNDLVHVALVWLDPADRFFWEDMAYWELQALDGTRCTVYRRVAKRIGLLDHLARLNGFSRAVAVRALGQRDYASVWSRDPVACPRCAGAMETQQQSGFWRCDRLLRCPACGAELPLGRQRVADV